VGDPADDLVDVSPDGRELWIMTREARLRSSMIGKKLLRRSTPGGLGCQPVKFTPDGKHVLISRLSGGGSSGDGNIVVFDAATRAVIKRIDAGGGVGGILVQPDGARAFGSARTGVVVIDLKTFAVVGRIDVGPNPDGLAWASRP
jgi:DNA-binding beta-propeller fold protein YncE